MKRYSFLLLEVLIALSILSIAIIPLMSLPFRCMKEESKSLELMTLERIALDSFLEVKELLYKNEIPWKTIIKRKHVKLKPYLEKTLSIELNKKLKGTYKEKISIYSTKKKESPYYLVRVKLEFQRTDEVDKNHWLAFIYPLIVEAS